MASTIGNTPSPIQNFDFQRMQKVVSLVDGGPFKSLDSAQISSAAAAAQGPQDVIIMRPSHQGMFTSNTADAQSIAKQLASKGVKVDEALNGTTAVTAHVDSAQQQQLEKEGWKVFDNRPRNLVPAFPAATTSIASRRRHARAEEDAPPTDGGDDDTTMPKVDFVHLTHADSLQQKGLTGKGQVIAVIDSGFDHPGTDLVAWKDFVDGSADEIDPVGHGTHVAGDILQMAPDAQIASVRVMNAEGQGRPSDIIKGIQWVIANKDQLHIGTINMSLGGEPDGTPSSENPLDQAVEDAIKKGITVITAAGNSGPGEHTIGSPADDPLGIAVGSSLNATQLSDFSSRGPTDDNKHKPDVVAPGEFIVSWAVPNSQMEQMGQVVEKLRHMPDDQLVKLLTAKPQLIEALKLPQDILSMDSADRLKALHKALPPIYMPDPDHIAAPGTSFASPITAGLVADLKQASPLTPQQVKTVLTRTADPMDSKFGVDDQGAGFIDGDKALAAVPTQHLRA